MKGSVHITFDARRDGKKLHAPLTLRYGPGGGETRDSAPVKDGYIDWEKLSRRLVDYARAGVVAARIDLWNVTRLEDFRVQGVLIDELRLQRALGRAAEAGMVVTIAVPDVFAPKGKQGALL